MNNFCPTLCIDVDTCATDGYASVVDKPLPKLLKKFIGDAPLMSVSEVAERTGFSRTTIYRHLSGETTPSRRDRRVYAKVFGFSTADDFDEAWRTNRVPQYAGDPHGGIPILSEIPAGPGTDMQGAYDQGIGEGYISRQVVGVQDPTAYVVRVKGDSMSPTLSDGDLVVCSPEAVRERGFEDGSIYAVRLSAELNDEATIKRVHVLGEEEIELVPVNPRHKRRRIKLEHIAGAAKAVKVLSDLE